MTGALVLITITSGVIYLLRHSLQEVRSLLDRRADHRRGEQLAARLYRADQQIRKEASRARRGMNDAAGQSWRNRFE